MQADARVPGVYPRASRKRARGPRSQAAVFQVEASRMRRGAYPRAKEEMPVFPGCEPVAPTLAASVTRKDDAEGRASARQKERPRSRGYMWPLRAPKGGISGHCAFPGGLIWDGGTRAAACRVKSLITLPRGSAHALLTIHAEKLRRKSLKPCRCWSGKLYFTAAS